MKNAFRLSGVAAIILSAIFAAAQAAQAEVKVTLSDMHICCPGCVSAIQKAAAKAPGVQCKASEDDATAVITADSKADAQKAVDEIVKAGFNGTPDDKDIKIAPVNAPDGKVQSLEIAHVHNCCGKCAVALKGALKDVPGVTSTTIQPKATSFVVQGNFSADDVVKALMKAGFYPELKEAK